jgi:protein O-GlcNAc transferase
VDSGLKLTELHVLRGNALEALGRYEEAAVSREEALDLDPEADFVLGNLFHARLLCCDWTDHAATLAAVRAGVRAGRRTVPPYQFLCMSDSAEEQLACAQTLVRDDPALSRDPGWPGEFHHHDRIRLAYISADFRDQLVAHIFAGLFENHDRDRFEVTGVFLAKADSSAIARRIGNAFDRFVDASTLSDAETSACLRDLEIAVDLMGHTRGCRPAILARRLAPIQIGFLGYAGSTGMPFIDYIIADRSVNPESARGDYSEQPVFLPDT